MTFGPANVYPVKGEMLYKTTEKQLKINNFSVERSIIRAHDSQSSYTLRYHACKVANHAKFALKSGPLAPRI